MGIIGVLLAGGCPDPTSQVSHGFKTLSRGFKGKKIKVGESVSSSGGKGTKIAAPNVNESGNTKARILIVAPSNAAVDELVTRLVVNGVPGLDGGVFFPSVVRVGGPRVGDTDGPRGVDAGGPRGGDADEQCDPGVKEGRRQRMSPLVQVGYQSEPIVR